MKKRRFFSWFFFISGLVLFLFSISYPAVSWYWLWFNRPPVLFDPEPTSKYPIPKLLNLQGYYQDLDMSDGSNWFSAPSVSTASASVVSSFLLSFPSLGLYDISVTANGTDLKLSPIHYPGSALPGQIGNSVILGHSAIPALNFFNRSLTVFNPLLKLKKGDLAEVDFAGRKLTYRINQIFEVNPDRIDVLNQPEDRRQLTLITCVPLGTYLRRLVVVGDLIN